MKQYEILKKIAQTIKKMQNETKWKKLIGALNDDE